MKSGCRDLAVRVVLCLLAVCGALPAHSGTLVIATVDNDDTLRLRSLSSAFEKDHPDIRIRWVVLDAQALRQAASADIQTQGGRFDVITIGNYKVPIWAARRWLKPIGPETVEDKHDLLPTVRDALSYEGELYAAPFSGESSVLIYRKDLLRRAGLTMPDSPTWNEIAGFAAKLHDPANGVSGVCLRGRPGWVENMALVTTMVNTFGGQWFDMHWRPQLDSGAWKEAVGLYVDLLSRFGPPDPTSMGHKENLALFQAGKCAMWVGSTDGAGSVTDPRLSLVAGEVGFAVAPTAAAAKGSNWLWTWSFAIPRTIEPAPEADARKFIRWATSHEYVELVAAKIGWTAIPTGSRKSTYSRPEVKRTMPWLVHELEALLGAHVTDATVSPSPYRGIQFAAIPEFMTIGNEVGKLIGEALVGRLTVDEALSRGQAAAQLHVTRGGYPK